jgi:hypothetical protein
MAAAFEAKNGAPKGNLCESCCEPGVKGANFSRTLRGAMEREMV